MFFPKLFSSLKIKGLTLKNRIMFPAMHLNMVSGNAPSERMLDFYEKRALGGAGIIVCGYVSPNIYADEDSLKNELLLHDDSMIPRYAKLSEVIKKHGSVAGLQISIYFMKPNFFVWKGADFKKKIKEYVSAAVRADRAGFDVIEILGSGGSFISFLLSPFYNIRKDEWGGSVENRTRFVKEIIYGIREELGHSKVISFRMHGDEFFEGGYSLKDACEIAHILSEAGVDIINVTGGGHFATVPQITAEVPEAGMSFLGQEIKKYVKGSVVAISNRIHTPDVAEKVLARGGGDIVVMGRPIIADPMLPEKAKQGRVNEIRRCTSCSICLDMSFKGESIKCSVNPELSNVFEMKGVRRVKTTKHILVIGGGVRGLRAAETLVKLGYRVTLWEEKNRVGGNYYYSFLPKGRDSLKYLILDLISYLVNSGVKIELEKKEINKESLKQFDHIVFCGGGRERTPQIPGLPENGFVFATEIFEGKIPESGRIVILGGGGTAIETAIFLASLRENPTVQEFLKEFGYTVVYPSERRFSYDITIITSQDKLGKGVPGSNRWVLKKELKNYGVKVVVKASVYSVSGNVLHYEKKQEKKSIEYDTLVIAKGFVKREVPEVVKQSGIPYLVIDSDIKTALHSSDEAFRTVLKHFQIEG